MILFERITSLDLLRTLVRLFKTLNHIGANQLKLYILKFFYIQYVNLNIGHSWTKLV